MEMGGGKLLSDRVVLHFLTFSVQEKENQFKTKNAAWCCLSDIPA